MQRSKPTSVLTRRRFATLAGCAAAAIMLPASARAQRERELNIYCWEGYDSSNVLDPFRKAFDCEVRSERNTSDPDAVERLRAGETAIWDLVTLNNPWARKVLDPEGLLVPLDRERYEAYQERMLPDFRAPYRWTTSEDGERLLGMAQRFGPFNFVVNTNHISLELAEDQGLALFRDPAMKGRYAVLAFDNWNILHICIAAGIDPFKPHDDGELARFHGVAQTMLGNARFLTDDAWLINNALINGEIDGYFSGGTYTASPARLDGLSHIRGVTPNSGPMDGKGAISWVEITSAVANPELSPLAFDFLDYIQQPETAKTVAFAEGTYNPVSQMGDPAVLQQFTAQELDALQWYSLEADMARCVDYDINPDYEVMLGLYNDAKRQMG
jgi:spermidine/putrescine transport system substrate-binding protein